MPQGAHGYPLPNKDMEAIFIAHGGRIRKKWQRSWFHCGFGAFSCLDVFPFVSKLLGINAPPNNGTNYLVDALVVPSKEYGSRLWVWIGFMLVYMGLNSMFPRVMSSFFQSVANKV